NPPASAKSENIRTAFLEAPELHPALDGGLLASWLSSGRPGRVLAGTLNALLRRAQEESTGREPAEPTAWIVLLAIRSLSQLALGTLREFPISGPAGRMLHGAVAAGLLLALRLAMREAGLPDSPIGAPCEAAAAVLPWLGGLRSLWGSGFAAYGVSFVEAPARIDHHLHRVAQGGTPEEVAADVAAELVGSKDAMRKASRHVALGLLRSDLLALVRMVEIGRAPPFSVEGLSLAQLYATPGALERVLAAPAARKEMHEKARATAKAATSDAARDIVETVGAEFLSREFYGPILTAAARHARGAAHLADKGGIYLNNLLGDAVSFSGDIVALLELAEDIRSALGSYALRLDSEGSREAVG